MALTAPAPRVLADVVPQSAVRDALLVAGGAAFVGLAAQVAVPLPFTPVPVTGQTFAVLLTAAAIGPLRGVLSMMLYLLAGLAGVPWFASQSAAFEGGVLVASFGYIVGFVVAAAVVGRLAERGWTRSPLRTAAIMVLGNVIIYAVGVTWLAINLGVGLGQAVEWGLTPFVAGDLLKVALAAGLFPLAWLGLTKAGLAPRDEA